MANPHDSRPFRFVPSVAFEPVTATPSRRSVIRGAAAAAAFGAAGFAVPAAAARHRELALTNLHTGESADVVLQEGGHFNPDALAEVNTVLRDHRTGEVAPIAPELLALLSDLRRRLDTRADYHVYSGYRSPRTNAKLAARSDGVAKKSFHTRGMAIDCYLPGLDLARLHRAALAAERGGVGLYARTGFVHLDVGPVRRW